MEQKNSNVVTFDDLARFTEEILLPGIEQIMDDKLENNLAPIRKEISDMRTEFRAEFDGMYQELADIHSEIHSIRLDLDNLEAQVSRLEKMVKEDLNAYADNIIKIKKELKNLQFRFDATRT